jgi:hypothetical protein
MKRLLEKLENVVELKLVEVEKTKAIYAGSTDHDDSQYYDVSTAYDTSQTYDYSQHND